MSERLSKEEWNRRLRNWMGDTAQSVALGEVSWQAIEADREAVRAETREEVLKDHFRIGDECRIQNGLGSWEWGYIQANNTTTRTNNPNIVRRPAKKRPTTRAERVEALRGFITGPISLASNGAVEQMCRDAGIALEVDE